MLDLPGPVLQHDCVPDRVERLRYDYMGGQRPPRLLEHPAQRGGGRAGGRARGVPAALAAPQPVRRAWQSPGAWIGFRDGLDGLDTARFPEAQFGALATKAMPDGYPQAACVAGNSALALAICQAHAGQGCAIDQAGALWAGSMK